MFDSVLASSTSPATMRIGQEPSGRWVRAHQSYAAAAASSWPPTTSAIAPSTWFHASVCSPGDQGIAPSGSCIPAMLAADAAIWSVVRTVVTKRRPVCGGTAPCSCR